MAEMSASLPEQVKPMRAASKSEGEFIDALTALQIAKHADDSPAQLIARFEVIGPEAAKGRRRTPGIDASAKLAETRVLTDAQRAIVAAGVTAAAAPKATMLLFAFHPGRRGPLPRGASRTDIEQALTGWTVIDEEHADTSGMPGPLKKAAPLWYRLRRS